MPPLVVLVARALVVAFWFLIGAGFEVGPLGGVVILHLLALDPAWFSSPRVAPLDLLFYDGSCALCHGAVRFVLAEDPAGTAFRFAPLRGSAFRTAIPEAEQATLPDSIVIRTAAGRTLVRSRAVIRMGMRLGGFWRVIAAGFWLIPVALRDAGYDLVAKWRYRIFGRRQEICPVMGEGLRARFDL
jgi:predicted DCC family thiol-disulfide oxidoreductase YuxK